MSRWPVKKADNIRQARNMKVCKVERQADEQTVHKKNRGQIGLQIQ
jgi:hypothetical protein